MKWIYALPLVLLSCKPQQPSEHRISKGDKAACPYLTTDAKGNAVLSWVEGEALYFAVADNDQFGAPVSVASAQHIQPHAENLPKMLFRPNGQVIAMFGTAANDERNKYAGKVYYTVSPDGGQHWGPAIPLVSDTSSYDQRYFDMALLPDGRAAAVWLDNRKNTTAEGSSLYYAVLSGERFGQERSITDRVCQCCRTDLYVDEEAGMHVVYRAIFNDTVRDMAHVLSTDGGATFGSPQRISADNWAIKGCPHTGPTMVKTATGLHFAWFTMGGGEGVFYCQSKDNGISYTKRESIAALPTAKHPQLAVLGNTSLALAWDEAVNVGGKYNNRVGLQLRNASGVHTRFITTDSAFASYPVLQPVRKHELLVAYKKREGEAERVYWQLINLE